MSLEERTEKSSYNDPRSQINKREQRKGTCKKKDPRKLTQMDYRRKKKASQKISGVSNCNHPPSDYHKCA